MRKNAIVYTRVSTDEQNNGYSPADQKEKLLKFCENNNIDVVGFYHDDESGKSFDRPQWIKIMAYLKRNNGKVDYIYFLKWDRFSRNVADAYITIRTLKKLGVEPRAIEQPLDFEIPESKIMLSIYLAAPEVDNDRRALNILAGMRRAKKDGRWLGNCPIGYKNTRDENNKPVIVPEGGQKEKLILEAFTQFSTGLYNMEENESILVKSHKPFENFTIPSQKTSKRAVSKDVINSIRNFPLESNSAFWHDKNYFLFMFNMQGMNFIDLAKLKLRQISAGRLRYIRSKTNKPYDVKLTKEAEEILSYYITNKTPEDFVFPILNKEINKDSILVSKTSDQALHVFNNHIKKLAVQCGIDQPITSYVARHSWASAARKLGVSTDKIGDALGHENYSTTEVYLQDFDTDVLDEVNLLVTSK